MKSLKGIQLLSKVGMILSKIVFIFAIVGACGCVLGITSLAIAKGTGFDFSELFVKLEIEEKFNFETMITAIAVGLVACVAEIFLAREAGKYFEHELSVGQPFTHELAKEMRRLGIIAIIVSFSVTVVSAIGVAIARVALPSIGEVNPTDFGSFGIGLAFIIVSLLCDYGADRGKEVIDVTSEEK